MPVSDYDGTGVLNDKIHKKYNVGKKGHIALQLHRQSQNFIRFKDIKIRPIMMAHTKLLVPKIFPSKRAAEISTARVVIPETNTVKYK